LGEYNSAILDIETSVAELNDALSTPNGELKDKIKEQLAEKNERL
jgi:hypothetical protein